MKKTLCLFLTILFIFPLAACGETDIPPVEYQKPTFTPGIFQSEQLTVEQGNYDRACVTGIGTFLESETGYYLQRFGLLYYAEKGNGDAWYYVCSEPDCNHSTSSCTANTGAGNYRYVDGRLVFSASRNNYPQFQKDGILFLSIDLTGKNVRLEQVFDKIGLDDSFVTTCVYPDGYLTRIYHFNPDGSYTGYVYLIDLDGNTTKVFQREYEQQPILGPTVTGRWGWGLGGDISIQSHTFTDDLSYTDLLCWFRDGEPVFTDVSQIPVTGGYLQGNIVRCLYPGDGYYDVDLLTGEKTKLADAQLTESKAMILQPNCIIETTLLNPGANVEVQEMRFFDGVQWHTVALPEEMRNAPDDTFEVVMLASDRVIFSVKRNGEAPGYYGLKSSRIFYQMELEATEYQVTYMGTFTMPTA